MKILVVGNWLFAGALNRALRGKHQVISSKEEDLAKWLRREPEVVLVDGEAMGLAGLDVVQELRHLGYNGPVYLTQSEGMAPSRWVKALIDDGTVKGLLPKPWTPQDIASWFENLSPPSHQQQ